MLSFNIRCTRYQQNTPIPEESSVQSVHYNQIHFFFSAPLPPSVRACVYAELIVFAGFSTIEVPLLTINETFLSFSLQQDICGLHCQREDSNCYRAPGIQRIRELLRIQITRSVNDGEGGSSVKNGYWNGAEECQRDKEKNERCCSVNTGPPVPTHPGPPQQVGKGYIFIMIPLLKYHLHFPPTSFKKQKKK